MNVFLFDLCVYHLLLYAENKPAHEQTDDTNVFNKTSTDRYTSYSVSYGIRRRCFISCRPLGPASSSS